MDNQKLLNARGNAGLRFGKAGTNRINVSWPFGSLTVTSGGVSVGVVFAKWSVDWADVASAAAYQPQGWGVLAGCSVIFVRKDGSRCFFSTYDTGAYTTLIQLLEDRGVPLSQGRDAFRQTGRSWRG
jgi:hypothetical protein